MPPSPHANEPMLPPRRPVVLLVWAVGCLLCGAYLTVLLIEDVLNLLVGVGGSHDSVVCVAFPIAALAAFEFRAVILRRAGAAAVIARCLWIVAIGIVALVVLTGLGGRASISDLGTLAVA